jgi:hypothetical protein
MYHISTIVELTYTLVGPGSHQEPGFHLAFAFDLDLATWLTDKLIFDEFVRLAGYLDATGHTVRLHAVGSIYGVAEQLECEFLATDHAPHHRARVDPDANV